MEHRLNGDKKEEKRNAEKKSGNRIVSGNDYYDVGRL